MTAAGSADGQQEREAWDRAADAVTEMLAEAQARQRVDAGSDVAADLIRWASAVAVHLDLSEPSS